MSVNRKEINIVRANDGSFIISSGSPVSPQEIDLGTAKDFTELVASLQVRLASENVPNFPSPQQAETTLN